MVRRHGPLLPFSTEGLEAKHQPLKRMAKTHTNRRGAHTTTFAANPYILQVSRMDAYTGHVKELVPRGHGTAKEHNRDVDKDPLSAALALIQSDIMSVLRPLPFENS